MERQNVWPGKAEVTKDHTDGKGQSVKAGETVRVDSHTGGDGDNFEVVKGDNKTEVVVPASKLKQGHTK